MLWVGSDCCEIEVSFVKRKQLLWGESDWIVVGGGKAIGLLWTENDWIVVGRKPLLWGECDCCGGGND